MVTDTSADGPVRERGGTVASNRPVLVNAARAAYHSPRGGSLCVDGRDGVCLPMPIAAERTI